MRDHFVRFRLSEAERQALDRMLELEDRKPGEFLRELLRAEASRRGLWPLLARAREQARATEEAA